MPIRLTVADGHPLIRYGLRELLSSHPDIQIVAECASAAEAVAAAAAARPDVITLDSALPDGDGLALVRQLRGRYPGLGIVVLTGQDEASMLLRAAEAGASAFVAKTAPPGEVLAGIRHAAVAPASFSAAGLAAALTRRGQAPGPPGLSQREREVLRLLRDGLSVPAIARTMFISQSTAKTYVARLYDKLGAANRAQALMAALRLGLIGHGPDQPAPVPVIGPRQPAAADWQPTAALAS